MKKIILSLLLGSTFLATAQELTINDALRYAQTHINGTARFRGMGGAFGAVGGDLSAINVNPAGSLFFKNNFASVSLTSFNVQNQATYFGTNNKENFNTLDLNQIGVVFVFDSKSSKKDWNKIAFSLNYDNTSNFDNRIFAAGRNPNHSVSQYFVNQANFNANTSFNDYQYDMAYETYIINEDPNNPNAFVSNVPTGSYNQEYFATSNGYNGKLTANLATAYQDKLFLGLNINAHFTDYTLSSSVYEANNNLLNPATQPSVREILFNNQLSTYGSGFSFNLGAIYKIHKNFRIGAAYESPTWYQLNDELVQDLYTYNNANVPLGDGNRYYGSPLFVFPTYKLRTPSKLTGSAAIIFGKRGLLSIDVTSKDYSNIAFRNTKTSDFRDLNRAMDLNYKNAYELRMGGEYKVKQWSLRGGYRFEESPLKVDYAMGDLTGINAGLGYNFGESRLDLAYSSESRNATTPFISSGMNDTARLNRTNNTITMSYSINF